MTNKNAKLNSNRGSTKVWVIIVGLVIVAAIAYLIVNRGNSYVVAPTGYTATSTTATTSTTDNSDQPTPVINSISPSSGPIGTNMNIKGSNLNGFEGDLNAWIVNSNGQKGIIYGDKTNSNSSQISFKLANEYCTADTSYSGAPCPSYMNIVPGTYSIFVNPWGKESNKVRFVITK